MAILRSLIVLLLFSCVAYLLTVTVQGKLNLRSDLNSVIPEGEQPEEILQLEQRLQGLSSQQIVLLVGAKHEEGLYDAIDSLNNFIESNKELTKVFDEARFFDTVLPLLVEHRFQLLAQEDRQQSQDLDYFIKRGREQFQAWDTGPARYSEDLLGTLNQYIREASGGGDNSIFHALWQGADYHFQPVVLTAHSDGMNLANQQALSQQFQSLKAVLQVDHDVVVLETGVVFFSTYAAEKAKSEINWIAGISSVAIILLCLLVFQSLRPLMFALTSVGFGVSAAFVVCHWWFGGLNILTLVFGSALIGVAVDFCIHYCYSVSKTGSDRFRHVAAPMLLSLVSSVVGYGALMMTQLSGLVEIAVFSMAGLVFACAYVLALGDYHLGRRPLRARALKYLPASVKTQNPLVLPGVALFVFLVLLSLAASDKLHFDSNPRSFYSASPELLAQATFINQHLGGSEQNRYLAILADSEAQIMHALDEHIVNLEQMKTDGALGGYESIRRWVPGSEVQRENYGLFKSLLVSATPSTFESYGINKEVGDSYLRKFAESEFLELEATEFVTALGDQGQWYLMNFDGTFAVIVRLSEISDPQVIKDYASNQNGVFWVDSVDNMVLGLSALQHKALMYLVLSYILIFALLSVFIRIGNAAMVISLPLLSSLLVVLILVGTGQALSLFHCLALYLVLGLGIDYGVFMFASKSRLSTYSGVLVSALTSVLAFGLLVFSSTPFIREFGLVVMLGCVSNAVLALVVTRRRITSQSFA